MRKGFHEVLQISTEVLRFETQAAGYDSGVDLFYDPLTEVEAEGEAEAGGVSVDSQEDNDILSETGSCSPHVKRCCT
nr:hypothetical transcript [Hymenolepis microstoma]